MRCGVVALWPQPMVWKVGVFLFPSSCSGQICSRPFILGRSHLPADLMRCDPSRIFRSQPQGADQQKQQTPLASSHHGGPASSSISSISMALRRARGFTRYAFSVTYHGAVHLGIAYQGEGRGENCILPDGTDLRGVRSVEGRIRQALSSLVGPSNYENFQVSSRTDRGVHALKNTCHVDIRPRKGWWSASSSDTSTNSGNNSDRTSNDDAGAGWDVKGLKQGINYYLRQQSNIVRTDDAQSTTKLSRKRSRSALHQQSNAHNSSLPWVMYQSSVENYVRILNVLPAPLTAPNKFYTGGADCTEPAEIDWNIRFTAKSRTYCYRVLHMVGDERDAYVPFEFDRSWRIVGDDEPLDIDAMNSAGEALVGRHDFTSFRGRDCQRLSPVVTLNEILISSTPYSQLLHLNCNIGDSDELNASSSVRLYTIQITGESFVYRQVRNIVGCLVKVGQGKVTAAEVKEILQERKRRLAPAMAPAHGLFLVDVKHHGLDL